MSDDTIIRTIHGVECIVTIRTRYVTLCICGKHHHFHGRNVPEVELLLWNWLHRRPRYKTDMRDIEQDMRDLLRIIRLPSEPIRVSAGHIKPTGRDTWIVRRSMDGEGRHKLYFGAHHNIHAAKRASIRLCQIINEEIKVRNALLSVNESSSLQ